jgi:hypothetical protein
MGFKALCFGLLCVSFLSCIYTPVPDNIEETWKVMALDTVAKTCSLMVRRIYFFLLVRTNVFEYFYNTIDIFLKENIFKIMLI